MTTNKKPENESEVIDIATPAPNGHAIAKYEGVARSLTLTPAFDIEQAKQRLKVLQEFVSHYLIDGEDYGIIPGTKKPTLLKSGADKLCDIYSLADTYDMTAKTEDWNNGLFDYEFTCTLKFRGTDVIASTGVGSCSSFETKYRWRETKRKCPKCGKEAIIKGKVEYGGGWLCFKKMDGCGANFPDTDPSITGQTVGRVQNEDMADQKNTVLKMAKKRAKIDAVIGATRSSGLFTQDMEDLRPTEPEEPVAHATAKPANAPPTPPSAKPAPKPTPAKKPTSPPPATKPTPVVKAEIPTTLGEPAKPATVATPKTLSDRAKDIASTVGCSPQNVLQLMVRHLGLQEMGEIKGHKRAPSVVSALETTLNEYFNDKASVRAFICEDGKYDPRIKDLFNRAFVSFDEEVIPF